MKINTKTLAVMVLAVTGLVIAGYMIGKQSGSKIAQEAGKQVSTQAIVPKPATTTPPAEQHPAQLKSHAAGSQSEGVTPINKDEKFTHFRVGNRNVKDILSDGETVWVGFSGGVIRYDITTGNYKLYDTRNGLMSNGVFHVSKMDDDTIALGTYGGGLSLFNTKTDRWKNLNIPDGLGDAFVYDILKAKNGDIWVATWSGVNRVLGGDLYNRSKWDLFTEENTKGGLPNDWVYGLAEGKDGKIWLGTEGGLALFADGKWTNWQHANGLGASYEKVKDDIQYKNDPGKFSSHHAKQKAEQGLGDVDIAYNPNYIISLVVDRRDGVVWCGTWGAGLARFDGKEWKNYTVADGLPGNHVFMLYQDADGALWAGTSKGLARMNDDGSFKVFTKADGLFADNVFSMTKASDGSVWVGSFGGVARISPEVLQ